MMLNTKLWTVQYVFLGHSVITSNALLLLASSINYTTADWSVWSACSKSCGSGLQTRNRSCVAVLGCNDTLQARECYTQRCYDLHKSIVLVILVTAFVISVMTAALFCIFFRRKQQRPKHKGSTTLEFSTCTRFRTYATDDISMGVRNLRTDSHGLVESRQTLSGSDK